VNRVVVNDLANDTFYARIVLDIEGPDGSRSLEIDARPSDAIALAVRVQVPIFAEEAVLEKAGVHLDKEGESAESVLSQPEPMGKVDEEELKRMSAFREFIESLDLSDLDERKS